MKLLSLSIRHFRSITDTAKLHLRDGVTTLIGANNEGKSNVLHALVAALEVASRLDHFRLAKGGRLLGHLTDRFYRWEIDYPIGLQDTRPNGRSEFELEFQLTPDEVVAFKSEVGSSLNGTLPIRLGLGKGEPTFAVRKRGPGAKTLSEKADKIARFIGKRLDMQYIPAIRPASASTSVVERLVASELSALRSDPDYEAAVRRIDELQMPILQKIGQSIRETLQVFLPDVKDVQVHVPPDARHRALTRSCVVVVDDGTPTSLERKGDGVQSLAALGLMRHAAQGPASTKRLVLAIEEPESHLHPTAIHQLRDVLGSIAQQHQVIITTHCPLFVDRREVGSNILVSNNRAAPAHSIKQLRDALGVRVADNLVAAEVLLLVEGEADRTALLSLLSLHSPRLKKSLASGFLGIDSLLGSGKLSYKLSLAREAMCTTHALLDNDTAGKDAVRRATDQGLVTIADVTFTACPGMNQSEFEDWYDPGFLAPVIDKHFGIPPASPEHTATEKKWSERMKGLFHASGKPWDDVISIALKTRIADAVAAAPKAALHSARRSSFDALVYSLESKLG